MADLLQHVRHSGFPFSERIIHLFVGGSELHGAKVQGTDDLDIYGVYILSGPLPATTFVMDPTTLM
jgi:hypothetical protein